MTSSANNSYTNEEINAWVKQLHELESSAMAGRIMTDEEYNALISIGDRWQLFSKIFRQNFAAKGRNPKISCIVRNRTNA